MTGQAQANGSDDESESGRRSSGKSDAAFRTISEVSTDLGVPQHVLRFWETKFSQIRPMKRGGGRRYYRPEDVALLAAIRDLLYNDGYTIKGAQKLLRENGVKAIVAQTDGGRERLGLDAPDKAGPEPAAQAEAPPEPEPEPEPETAPVLDEAITDAPSFEDEDDSETLVLGDDDVYDEAEDGNEDGQGAGSGFDPDEPGAPEAFDEPEEVVVQAERPDLPPVTAQAAPPPPPKAPVPAPGSTVATHPSPTAEPPPAPFVRAGPRTPGTQPAPPPPPPPAIGEQQRMELEGILQDLLDMQRILRQAGL